MSETGNRNPRVQDAKRFLAERLEAAYTSALITVGIVFGLLGVFADVTFQYQETIMVAVLLFGVINVPRVEDLPSEVIKVFLTALVGVEAALYVQLTNPSAITGAATLALVLLFGATATNSVTKAKIGELATSDEIKRRGPYLGAMFGIGALTFLIL
jgi:hypothetical protein